MGHRVGIFALQSRFQLNSQRGKQRRSLELPLQQQREKIKPNTQSRLILGVRNGSSRWSESALIGPFPAPGTLFRTYTGVESLIFHCPYDPRKTFCTTVRMSHKCRTEYRSTRTKFFLTSLFTEIEICRAGKSSSKRTIK